MQDQLVPLGGNRIPDGLQGTLDWKSLPEVQNTEATDFGPLYSSIYLVRLSIGEIKRVCAGIAAPVQDYIFFTEDGEKEKASEANKILLRQIEELEQMLEALKAKWTPFEQELVNCELNEKDKDDIKNVVKVALNSTEESISNLKSATENVLETCLDKLKQQSGKEIYGDFMLQLTGYTRTLFAQQSKTLGALKSVKKSKSS